MEESNAALICEEKKMSKDINADKFEVANRWLYLQNRNISFLEKLKNTGVDKIILYGASEFALRLLEQCENENNIVEIIGIVDRSISSKGTFYKSIPLLSFNDILKLDMRNVKIIITAMGFCEEIKNNLEEKEIINFISLKELIYDAYCNMS